MGFQKDSRSTATVECVVSQIMLLESFQVPHLCYRWCNDRSADALIEESQGGNKMGIGFEIKDFDTSKLDSFWNVIVLNHDPIDTFVEMWYHVFLWSLFSSVIIHIIASAVAFTSLRRHKIARYGPLLILLSSIVTPLFSYSITSAVIACVYRTASFVMYPIYAMFWGCGLTLTTSLFSFSRVLATL